MIINSTMLVEELKEEIKINFGFDVEILTTAGNIAGDKRRIRALCAHGEGVLPANISSDKLDSFIRRCKRKIGLQIVLSEISSAEEKNEKDTNLNFEELLIGSISFKSTPKAILNKLIGLFEQKNIQGLLEFNLSLINLINSNPAFYWLLPLSSKICDKLSDEEELEVSFGISSYGLNINFADFTLFFNETWDVASAEAPFQQAKDFKWFTSEEEKEQNTNGGSFISALVSKFNSNIPDFDNSAKSELLFNLGASVMWISAGNWCSENEEEPEETAEGLATLIWSVIESANFEIQTLNEYTNELPHLLINEALSINVESYNSEENGDYQSYRDYAIDWKAVCLDIIEGSGFSIDNNGPFGTGFLSESELQKEILDLSTPNSIIKLKNDKEFSSLDIPVKITKQDFFLIKGLFRDEWRIPTSKEVKELFELRENNDLNFDLDEAYISSDNDFDQITGVMFFDDGEFDIRDGRLFAGKIRLVRK